MIGSLGAEDVLSKVPPRAVRAYVVAHGWHRVEAYGDVGDVYEFDCKTPEIVVPVVFPVADYRIRLGQIVEILARAEERDYVAVVSDLLLADVDVVRIRIPGFNGDSSVPIGTGANVIERSRDMVLAAACAASRPQRAFRAGRNREASDYISTVRLGQTGRGSFVVNVLSPVPPILQPGFFNDVRDEPFPRRVMHRLASGLRAMRQAVVLTNRESTIQVFEDRVGDGVSANLCDAIGEMLGEGDDAGLDISVSWSLNRSSMEEPARVHFDAWHAPLLKEASRMLWDQQDRPDERIEGYVTSLARRESEYQGRVRIKGFVDGTICSIGADFSPRDYSRVADAHDTRRVISLEGDLRRDGQRWILDNPRDLMVFEDDED